MRLNPQNHSLTGEKTLKIRNSFNDIFYTLFNNNKKTEKMKLYKLSVCNKFLEVLSTFKNSHHRSGVVIATNR